MHQTTARRDDQGYHSAVEADFNKCGLFADAKILASSKHRISWKKYQL